MVQNLVFNKNMEASIYLPDDTQPDKKAMEELQQLMELQTTIERLLQQPGYFSDDPIDPNRNDLKGRRDILKKWEEGIRSEAPYAYKDIDQVVNVHKQHDLAGLVARMEPVFTVKA